jgi:hypothetical protein
MMKLSYRLSLTLGLAVSAVAVSLGYSYSGHKWSVRQVPYYINPANNDVSREAALAAIQQAAGAWSTQSNADFSFYYMGETSGNAVTNDGKNEVFFRNDTNSNIAQTFRWWNSAGTLVDTDIVFYDGSWKFFAGYAGCSSGFYIEEIATHEFGHALGLNHSDVSTATMYPGAARCASWKGTLDPDDLAALEAVYPATKTETNTAPTVSVDTPISGTAVAEGTPVSFQGTATDKEDGALTSMLAWSSNLEGPLGGGGSFTRVLVAGNHSITASVTDSRGVTSQVQRSLTVEADAPEIPPSAITLSARGYKVKGAQRVDLTWAGATTSSVVIFRDSTTMTTRNDGAHTDAINKKGGGGYTYRVCESGTSICSAPVIVQF